MKEVFLNCPFKKDEKIVLAVSCGKDSMCMLDLFFKNKYNIVVCHVNHNKRKESIIEENFITNYCKNNNIKLYKYNYFYSGSGNFQKEAREKRYEFFYEILKKENSNYILTAHHAMDNLETIIKNIIFGSSLSGYSGIKKLINFHDKYIYRPLLDISLEKILSYNKINNITYFNDSSNFETNYLRNNIRINVVKNLYKINKNLDKKIKQYSNILQEIDSFLEYKTNDFLLNPTINKYSLLDSFLQKNIIKKILEKNNIEKNYNQINLIQKFLLNKNKPNSSFFINNNIYIKKDNNLITISNDIQKKEFKSLKINDFNKEYTFLNYKISFIKNISNITDSYYKLCYNNLEFNILLRTRMPGDRLYFSYGSKKLKNLFIDKKINKDTRDSIPILEINSNICYIPNLYNNLIKGSNYLYIVFKKMEK